jgi:prepilin-type N-terminal cleavage/methylation domain-containing protein
MNVRVNRWCSRFRVRAFTLIELMIVCAIIGAVLAISIPTIYRHFHPESLVGTVRSLVEACSHARAHAILSGTPTELIIRPGDRSFTVSQAPTDSYITQVRAPERLDSKSVSGEDWRMEERESSSTSGSGAGIFSGRISEKIIIEMLDVNFVEYREAEAARVRFYPNGTSDEFTIVLHGDDDQWRKISLEVVTGLPDLSSDPTKWVKR